MRPLQPTDPVRVGRYDLEGTLGTGGMGTVYLGRSPGGRPAAIKVINPAYLTHPEALARFRREAEMLGTVRSAYTATLIDSELAAPPYWMATEYIPGPTLASTVTEDGPMSPRWSARLMAALAEGLADIHKHGICHRDLKPQNVILSSTGPQLIDFGIARSLGQSGLTMTGVTMGTPGYIAPELMITDELTPAADVFALGATIAHAATARRPYGGGTLETIYLRLVQEDIDLDGVEPGLADLIRACVVKEPAWRPSPDEIITRCRDLLDASARPRDTAPPTARRYPPASDEPHDAGRRFPPATGEPHHVARRVPPASDEPHRVASRIPPASDGPHHVAGRIPDSGGRAAPRSDSGAAAAPAGAGTPAGSPRRAGATARSGFVGQEETETGAGSPRQLPAAASPAVGGWPPVPSGPPGQTGGRPARGRLLGVAVAAFVAVLMFAGGALVAAHFMAREPEPRDPAAATFPSTRPASSPATRPTTGPTSGPTSGPTTEAPSAGGTKPKSSRPATGPADTSPSPAASPSARPVRTPTTADGRCIRLPVKAVNGAQVTAAECDGSAAQRWSFTKEGAIMNAATTKCLDIGGNAGADIKFRIQIWDCSLNEAQTWVPEPDGTLFNTRSGRCLGILPAADGGPALALQTCVAGAAQRWKLPT